MSHNIYCFTFRSSLSSDLSRYITVRIYMFPPTNVPVAIIALQKGDARINPSSIQSAYSVLRTVFTRGDDNTVHQHQSPMKRSPSSEDSGLDGICTV